MWKPRSHHESDAAQEPVTLHEQTEKRRKESEREALDGFLEKYICSRLHQLIMEKLTIMRAGVADPKALARVCGAKEKEVVKVLKEWKTRGILTAISTYPYYYDPSPKFQETAELFMKAWRNEQEHGRLLKRILEREG